jgi:hypothetical protein
VPSRAISACLLRLMQSKKKRAYFRYALFEKVTSTGFNL